MQLGSSHAILVGDPQQLPATIFSISGRDTKYDRSLFARLEEAGHAVHMLDTQYRMVCLFRIHSGNYLLTHQTINIPLSFQHPAISDFPRRIFYDGKLADGPNVKHPEYGNPLKMAVFKKFPAFQVTPLLKIVSFQLHYSIEILEINFPFISTKKPFTILDLESSEERGGTSLANSAEAQLALHLFNSIKSGTNGLSTKSRVAVVSLSRVL